MKCKEAEPLIYLYSELDVDEKRFLDAHVATCQQCALISTRLGLFGELLNKARTNVPAPRHAAQLTSRIMQQVHSGSNAGKSPGWMGYGYWLRAAGMVTSLIVVITFGMEFSAGKYVINQKQLEVKVPALQVSPSQYWQARTRKSKPASRYDRYKILNTIKRNETKTIYTNEQI